MYIGYHAVFDPDYHDAIRYAADNGFDYVQFDLNVPRFFLERLSRGQARGLRQLTRDLGVGLSFHAPGDNVSLFTDYPSIRKGILAQFALILERANQAGARHLTVHPGFPPAFRKAGENHDAFRDAYREHYAAVLEENLRRIAARAGPMWICVENVGLLSTALPVVERLLGRSISLCWDIAKSQTQPEAEPYFRRNMGSVREVHVHDIDARGQHAALGEGRLELKPYLEVIRREGVATTIEVRPREAARQSRDTLLQMLSE
jgi:sugar phosphate isomerase/epimerase